MNGQVTGPHVEACASDIMSSPRGACAVGPQHAPLVQPMNVLCCAGGGSRAAGAQSILTTTFHPGQQPPLGCAAEQAINPLPLLRALLSAQKVVHQLSMLPGPWPSDARPCKRGVCITRGFPYSGHALCL